MEATDNLWSFCVSMGWKMSQWRQDTTLKPANSTEIG